MLPATATRVTITIPASEEGFKPTIVHYERGSFKWERYWTGYNYKGNYVERQHDFDTKGGPEGEVKWSQDNGYEVLIS